MNCENISRRKELICRWLINIALLIVGALITYKVANADEGYVCTPTAVVESNPTRVTPIVGKASPDRLVVRDGQVTLGGITYDPVQTTPYITIYRFGNAILIVKHTYPLELIAGLPSHAMLKYVCNEDTF